MSESLPSWIGATTIALMTAVFAFSVAVWRGEQLNREDNRIASSDVYPAAGRDEPRDNLSEFDASRASGSSRPEPDRSSPKRAEVSQAIWTVDTIPLLAPPLDAVPSPSDVLVASTESTPASSWKGETKSGSPNSDVNSTGSATHSDTTAIRVTGEQPVETAWPLSRSLLRELDAPIFSGPFFVGASSLSQRLHDLTAAKELDDPAIDQVLSELAVAAEQLWDTSREIAGVAPTKEQQSHAALVNRLSYELHRRVRLWEQVRDLAHSMTATEPSGVTTKTADFSQWKFDQVDPTWSKYLGLDSIGQVDGSRTQIARTILGRWKSVTLTELQRKQIDRIIDPQLEAALRAAATVPLDLKALLRDVEAHHWQPNGYTERRLNDHFQNLMWSNRAEYLQLIQTIEDHYRNANVRIAISESMLNRLVAGSRSSHEPVREQILGANVSGRSTVTNQLGIQLVPDEHQWSVVLTTKGNVASRTQASRDGFVIHSVGTANVLAAKQLGISYNGVRSELPRVEAVTDNQVIGLESPYDEIPVLGWTARRIAQRRQQAAAPQAELIVRSRIRSRIQERMEEVVTAALQKAQKELDRLILGRFAAWSLEPQPVEMSTTQDRLILRYRLAGFDQMAADTPRPALDDRSAISLQLHESAINNGLARLELSSRSFTINSLVRHLNEKLQVEWKVGESADHNVELEFAPYDPIRVDFGEDAISLTLHLKRLQIDRSKSWRNVTIETRYLVHFDGFYLTLEQVGGVRASGSRIRVREEMAIAAIVDRLLSDEYRFSLLPELYEDDFAALGIQLAHIGLDDGWLSVVYDQSPAAAEKVTQTYTRRPLR